jgi:lipid-A-disaccharide synthase
LGEIRHHVKTMIETAVEIQKRIPNVSFLLPLVSEDHRKTVQKFLDRSRSGGKHLAILEKLHIFVGQSRRVIEACDAALVASGTATLEAALYKKPMTVMYRMGTISWQLMHRMIKAPHVAMPNLLLNERVFPEWLQDEATPSNLSDSIIKQLDDVRLREQYKDRLTELHFSLRLGAGELARDAILNLLSDRKKHY